MASAALNSPRDHIQKYTVLWKRSDSTRSSLGVRLICSCMEQDGNRGWCGPCWNQALYVHLTCPWHYSPCARPVSEEPSVYCSSADAGLLSLLGHQTSQQEIFIVLCALDHNRYYLLSTESHWPNFSSSKGTTTPFALRRRHVSFDDVAPFLSMIEDKQLST